MKHTFTNILANLLWAAGLLIGPIASAQSGGQVSDTAFNIVGGAFHDTVNAPEQACFTITYDANWEAGAVWNNTPINLAYFFDLKFNMFLGAYNPNDPDTLGPCNIGADGLCFVLQNTNTGYYDAGFGIGYADFPNQSLGIEFDTYQNGWDPSYSHIAIEYNGQVEHPIGTLAGPVQMSNSKPYTTDSNWHAVEIKWNPQLDSMEVFFDDTFRVGYNFDSLGGLFHGVFMALDSNIYWGFTGATGAACNVAQVCMDSVAIVADIADIKTTSQVKLYPNPANNYLHIQSSIVVKNIVLEDISGQEIEQWIVDGSQFNINTTDLVPGAYLIRIQNADRSILNRKVMVVR